MRILHHHRTPGDDTGSTHQIGLLFEPANAEELERGRRGRAGDEIVCNRFGSEARHVGDASRNWRWSAEEVASHAGPLPGRRETEPLGPQKGTLS
jgi:hypothetical protein